MNITLCFIVCFAGMGSWGGGGGGGGGDWFIDCNLTAGCHKYQRWFLRYNVYPELESIKMDGRLCNKILPKMMCTVQGSI